MLTTCRLLFSSHLLFYILLTNPSFPTLYVSFLFLLSPSSSPFSPGQLTTTTDVENFPGFPDGVRGPEMMDKFRAQSERFGTKIITETISRLDLSSRPFKYWREGSEEGEQDYETADTIILATGASAKRLNLPGEEEYWQSGISACAVCDGAVPIFRNKPLAVIGGGDSAAEEATYLTKYGSKVYVLVRRGELRASKIMAKRLLAHPKVEVLWHVSTILTSQDVMHKSLMPFLALDFTHPPIMLIHHRPPQPNVSATAISSLPSLFKTSKTVQPPPSPSLVSSTPSVTNPQLN